MVHHHLDAAISRHRRLRLGNRHSIVGQSQFQLKTGAVASNGNGSRSNVDAVDVDARGACRRWDSGADILKIEGEEDVMRRCWKNERSLFFDEALFFLYQLFTKPNRNTWLLILIIVLLNSKSHRSAFLNTLIYLLNHIDLPS
jgi:hypothetical protein